MKNKFVKYLLITLGTLAISYGTWRTIEYFNGVVRLKYTKIKIVNYSSPPIETPLEE